MWVSVGSTVRSILFSSSVQIVFLKVLNRLRDDMRGGRYVVTLHADEEMYNDGLTVRDIESAILTGWIEERQRTGIVKSNSAGVVIGTVYLL
jgi:hypothetical protein